MSRSPGFDWDKDRDDLVVEEQAAIAVYLNPRGAIVIRQKGELDPSTYDTEDSWIIVEPHYAAALARAIMALAPQQGTLALPAPGDRTAAERQRRHRDRKRNGGVTPCDRDSVTGDRDTISGRVLAAN